MTGNGECKRSGGKGPYLAALLAPFFIALSIIIAKIAGNGANPLAIAGISSLMAVPMLLAGQVIMRRKLSFAPLFTQVRRPFLKVLLTRAIMGQALIVSGFTMTTAVKAVLLLRLEPIFVYLWTLSRGHEKPSLSKIGLLSLLLVGSLLVVLPPAGAGSLATASTGINLGDFYVVAALVFLSYSYMPTQEVVHKADPAALNILTSLFGGLAICAGAATSPGALLLSTERLWLVAANSFVFFVVASSLYFFAFKALKPWVIASFLSLEVVFGLILAAVILNERVSFIQLLGATVVLVVTLIIGRRQQSATS